MKLAGTISNFLATARTEPRFSPAHTSLFIAIIHQSDYLNNNPITTFSRQLMQQSKIAGPATFYRVLHELEEFGFIKYEPSYNPAKGSLIFIVNNED